MESRVGGGRWKPTPAHAAAPIHGEPRPSEQRCQVVRCPPRPGGEDASIALGRAPCSRGARTRALPRSPSASGGRPLRRAWGARGHRRLRGSSSAEAERTSSREDASVRGASPPSGHQSPDTSEIRLWVCGERNATQTPFLPRSPAQINTHKHAHRRRRGPHSQPRGPGVREGKCPGPGGVAAFAWQPRARPLTLTARRGDRSARRHRPGATAQRPVWARNLGGLGGAGAAAGHSW